MPSQNPTSHSLAGRQALFLLAAIALGLYGHTLGFGFLWDDHLLIVENDGLRLGHWQSLWQPLYPADPEELPYLRPVQRMSYWLDYKLFGLNPLGYHAVNLILFSGNLFLTAWLFRLVIPMGWLGASGLALLFGIHPMHTPPVAYISGRADLLAFLGLVGMVLLYLKRRPLWALASFALALGSKEAALVGPGLILLIEWRRRRWSLRGLAVRPVLLFLLLAGVYLGIRGNILLNAWSLPAAKPLTQRLLELPILTATYLKVLFLPWGPQLSRFVPPFQPQGAWPWLMGWGAGALAIGSWIWFWVRRPGSRWWLGWILLTSLPLSHLILPLPHPAADHWLILPAVGAFGLIGQALSRLPPRSSAKGMALAALGAWAVASFFVTQDYSRKWGQPLRLYAYQLEQNPTLIRTQANYAEELLTQGRPADAMEEALKAMDKKADFHHPWLVISRASLVVGSFSQALEAAQKALGLNETDRGFLLLGVARYELRQFDEAEAAFQKAIALSPSFRLGWEALGHFYWHRGQWDRAAKAYEALVKLEPESKEYQSYLAQALEHL